VQYNISIVGGHMKDVAGGAAEEAIKNPGNFSAGSFRFNSKLGVCIEAGVLRSADKETVSLRVGEKVVHLRRSGTNIPGDIGVSCSPDGSVAPVETINIEFRAIDDPYTDRGMVWVHPIEKPARMSFVITANAFKTPGLVTEIIAQAEKAVAEQVLAHFPH